MTENHSVPISVLMPVYNAEPYLGEAIESILNQTFGDFELLIINDGSTDGSEDIIQNYTDPRINYIKNDSNLKLIATLNKGITLCAGKYIVRMDADDISLPERLQKQYDFMEQNPDIAICGSWFEAFGVQTGNGKYLADHDHIMFKMLYQCHICHPSVIIRKNHLSEMKPLFDPEFAHAEDYDLFTRIGHQFRLANIPEVLIRYRNHTNSVSVQFKEVQDANSRVIRHRLFGWLGYPVSDRLLDDFIALNYQEYSKISSSATEIKKLLEGMWDANIQSRLWNVDFFKKQMQRLWFNFCYHYSQSPKTYFSSKLLSNKLNVNTITKWRIKQLFHL